MSEDQNNIILDNFNYEKLSSFNINLSNKYVPVLNELNEYPVYVKAYLNKTNNTIANISCIHNGISTEIYTPKLSTKINNLESIQDFIKLIEAETSARTKFDDFLSSLISTLNKNLTSRTFTVSYLDKDKFKELSDSNNLTTSNIVYLLSDINDMHMYRIYNVEDPDKKDDAINYTKVLNFLSTAENLSTEISSLITKIHNLSISLEEKDYMTIEALEDGVNVKIGRTGVRVYSGIFQVKLNNDDWKDVSWEDIGNSEYDLINVVSDKSSMSKGDKLKFRNIDKFSDNYNNNSQLLITEAKAKVYGKLAKSLTPEFAASSQKYKLACMFNIPKSKLSSASLVDASELNLNDIIISTGCYYGMFERCTSLTSAPKVLPATTLADYCYYKMFSGCTSLKSAPKVLPATTLASGCYMQMFFGCTSLTSVPKLPATELADNCYNCMFKGCTSLTSAPELPATTLDGSCYTSMFSGCTSLTSAPELPATTLASYCYQGMFGRCESLTSAPELPATTLAGSCYEAMFSGCTSLTSAPELPATKLAVYCYESMFSGCTSLTSAPKLPATTINSSCYESMFEGCTSLTSAPELPATEITRVCYSRMFSGCTSLKSAPKVLPATELADKCYSYMFEGCTSLISAPKLPATKFADLYNNCYESIFKGCTKITELHYPASIENDSTFKNLDGSPNFGAINAKVHYDL